MQGADAAVGVLAAAQEPSASVKRHDQRPLQIAQDRNESVCDQWIREAKAVDTAVASRMQVYLNGALALIHTH